MTQDIFNALNLISQNSDYQILKRAKLDYIEDVGQPYSLYIDTETTGFDNKNDKILSLSFLKIFHVGENVLGFSEPVTYFNDPQRPIPLEIIRLTGITDEMVKGQEIPVDDIKDTFLGAEIIIAHHSEFDRPFLERKMPYIKDTVWGCSHRDVSWQDAGFSKATLEFLLFKHGYFYDAHSSEADIVAGTLLIAHEGDYFKDILAKAKQQTYIIKAYGSRFQAKDDLKELGARWSQTEKVWSFTATSEDYDIIKKNIHDIYNDWKDDVSKVKTHLILPNGRFSLYPSFDVIETFKEIEQEKPKPKFVRVASTSNLDDEIPF